MRWVFFSSLVVALLVTTNRQPQAAPWCSLDSEGSTNCGFYSYQQCREHLAGVGGQCEQNPWEDAIERQPSYQADHYPAHQMRFAWRDERRTAGHWRTVREESSGWLIQRHSRSGAWRAVPAEPGRRVAYHWNGGAWVPAAYDSGRS
jgi:hypothetical protein